MPIKYAALNTKEYLNQLRLSLIIYDEWAPILASCACIYDKVMPVAPPSKVLINVPDATLRKLESLTLRVIGKEKIILF